MTVKNLKPLGNRALVKRTEPKQKKGSILLPDSAREKPKQGKVLAVGPGKMDEQGKLEPMQVKVGDEVLFSSYAGSQVKTDEEGEYLILSQDEILGVVSEPHSCCHC
jgi:chaperonin GroES